MSERRVNRGGQRTLMFVGLACAALLLLWHTDPGGIRLFPVADSRALDAPPLLAADGSTVTLESFRGRVVVVNLWASRCGPCRAEMPRLNRIQRDFQEQDVAVIGLNVEGLASGRLQQVSAQLGVEFPTLVPLRLLGGTSFEGQGVVPHTWIVDHQGRLRGSKAGVVSERSLRRAVRELIAERDAG